MAITRNSQSRIALNFAALAKHTALASKGRVARLHDVVICDPGSPHAWRNLAVPTRGLNEKETDELAEFLPEFFGTPRTWCVGSVMPLNPTNGRLEVDITEELMVFPAGTIDVNQPDELEIRDVRTASDMEVFEHVWATAYEKPHLLEPHAKRYDERILGNGQSLWLGYVGDQAVATGASWVCAGFNLVRGVTTLAEFRGRGIGSAMTRHAMNCWPGARYLNSELGVEEMYRSLGFQTVTSFKFWQAPRS